MTVTTTQPMTLEQYLAYDDGTDTRYELVDGALVEMGAESTLNTRIAVFLIQCFLQIGLTRDRLGIKQRIAIKGLDATAREPNLIVHSDASARAIDGAAQAIVTLSDPVPLVVIEIVSPGNPGEPNYDRDYIEKRQEYADRGIPDYWIVDPHRQVVLVLSLQGKTYQEQSFTGNRAIVSPTLPSLTVTAAQILTAGQS